MKRIIIVHGWGGSPENCWFPWMKKALEERGFKVLIPEMPNSEEPEINSWVSCLSNTAGEIDKDTYFVGHSIGCQAIMRLLEKSNDVAGGAVFVAGFFNLLNLETEEEKEIAKPWLETSIDCNKVKENIPKIVAIFSDNDPDVNIEEKEIFKNKLNASIIIEHNKGHFSDGDRIFSLPVALEAVLNMVGV